MSFDLSRYRFDPTKDYLGVVMQQGRVQLDSDWNEWLAELNRRIQAGTLDTVGRAVYPATTPNAFAIGFAGSGLTIGTGRMYVDGILVENHGLASAAQWDPALAEMSGAPQPPNSAGVALDLSAQPYPPGPAPTGNGPFLVYLDVWRRPVTYIEDPDLVEEAVGVDTTGRLQTVWQVKLIDASGLSGGITCSTPDSAIPGWSTLMLAPGGNLTTALVPSSAAGPCSLTPNTGYTGMENQLYRVEIHQGGALGTATFKWSRDNASVATGVTAVATVINLAGTSGSQLSVDSLGRDQVLGFNQGDWIEITDDYLQWSGQSGELHQIDSISVSAKTITLDSVISAANFPLVGGDTDPTRHTRICRWDQQGQIYQTGSGSTQVPYFDLGATGDIPIPASGTLILENGITVTFGLNPAGQPFKVGDFWTFAARTADGSVELLTAALSQGIHHHYARLAVVTFPSTLTDCRVSWPPASEGGSCGCTVTIQPSDLGANLTLQGLVDRYKNQASPTVICMMPGTYILTAPLRMTAAHANITLKACQNGTAILQVQSGLEAQFTDGMIVMDTVTGATLCGLQFDLPLCPYAPTQFAGVAVTTIDPDVSSALANLMVSIGIRPVNCTTLTVESCSFLFPSQAGIANANATPFGAGIFAAGSCQGFELKDNNFQGTGDFQAGFLLAPSVAFIPPPAIRFPIPLPLPIKFPIGTPITKLPLQNFGNPITFAGAGGLKGLTTDLAANELSKSKQTIQAKKPRASKAKLARSDSAVKMVSASGLVGKQVDIPLQGQPIATTIEKTPIEVAASNYKLIDPSLVAGDYLGGRTIFPSKAQQIVDGGTSTPNLSADGGNVLPAVLDECVFSGNSFSALTIAVLIVAESEYVEFTGNDVEGCTAGFWMLTPSQAALMILDPQNVALIGLTAALGYPLPLGNASTLAIVSPPPASIRIFASNAAVNYTDSTGNVWTPDAATTNVAISGTTSYATNVPPATVSGTSDPTLYQGERYGASFTYTFSALPAGFYQVTLKFAEIFDTSAAGQRLFNASLNGNPVLANFDIYANMGGPDLADDWVFNNVPANAEGQIIVAFSGGTTSPDKNAKISAIEIDPQWSASMPLIANLQSQAGSSAMNEFQLFFAQMATLGDQGYSALTVSPLRLRCVDNEMQGLSSAGVVVMGDDSVQNELTGTALLSGNRIEGQVPFNFRRAEVFGHISANYSQGLDGMFAFSSLVAVTSVTRCAVTGNIVVNDLETDSERASMIVDDLSLGQTYSQSGRVGLSISGNVFQGYFIARPLPGSVDSPAPSPMNTWAFFNTTVP